MEENAMAEVDAAQTVSMLLEAFRSRELRTGGISCSQVNATCSQTQSWIDNCKEQVPDLNDVSLTSLLEAAPACDVLDLLKALQAICRSEGPDKEGSKWFELANSCIADPGLVEGRKGKEIINFAINQVDQLDGQACADLAETLLNSIGPSSNENHEKCLDLLPKLLDKVGKVDRVVIKKSKETSSRTCEYSGDEYRTQAIDELCRLEWPKPLVVPIITVLRDLLLSEEQLRVAISRIARESCAMELQELPPLIYQLLLLSTQGHRQQVLGIVLSVFNDLDDRCKASLADSVRMSQDEVTETAVEESELVQVEGIVMLHFNFALKQDMSLGQELLRMLKQRVCDLSAFEAALLLSLSRIPRYEAKAMEILRKAAEHDFSHQCKLRSSAWIGGISEMKSPCSIEQVMRLVLRRSAKGWDHVVPGMIAFTFHLLETQARKCSGDWTGIPGGQQTATSSFTKNVAGTAVKCSLGLIERSFRVHSSVREDVLGRIFAHVLTRDESVPCFISLLGRIASRCSRDVIAYLPKVKEALEYVGYMTPATAVALVRALEPILRLQPTLHEYLMIVLRKSLFSREMESRLVALDCLLHLAMLPPRAAHPSASQVQAGQAGSSDAVEDVALEVVGQLRRCMAQQASMRQRLYSGLCEVVHAKPQLLEYVANILVLQLQRYCQENGEGRVLILEKCLDDGKNISEPIAHLLHAITQCIVAHTASLDGDESGMDEENSVLASAQKHMTKLLNWISSSELQDFDLDSSTSFSLDTEEGRRKANVARLLIGVYEALVEYDLMCTPVTERSYEERTEKMLLKLQELSTVLRENSKGTKGKKPASSVSEDKSTLFSFRLTEEVLALQGRNDPRSKFSAAAQDAMWSSHEFLPAMIQIAGRQVTQVKVSDLSLDGKKAVFELCCLRIAPRLVQQFVAQRDRRRYLPTTGSVKSKNQAPPTLIAVAVLRTLSSCVQFACSRFSKEQVAAMARELRKEIQAAGVEGMAVEELNDTAESDEAISACIRSMQQLFKFLVREDDESEMATCVMEIMTTLGDVLDCTALETHLEWTKRQCKEDGADIESKSSLVKGLVGSFLSMTLGDHALAEAAALASDVLALTHELEEGEEEGAATAELSYQIVCDDNVSAVVACLTDLVKTGCDEVEWVLGYVDASGRRDVLGDDAVADLPENIAAARASLAVEDLALGRLMGVVEVALTLAKCYRMEQAPTEGVIGGLARVYRAAEYTARRLLANKAAVRRPFQQLMHKIGAALNEAMYDVLTRYADVGSFLEGSKDSYRQKISREQKLLPTLIYHVERLEADLIKIQKEPANKNKVDFMKSFKRSVSRDFRVNTARLEEALSKEQQDKENQLNGIKKKRGKGKGKGKKGADEREDGDEDLSQAISEASQRSAKRARSSQQ